MCEFQSLYFGEDGYVVRCKKCGMYQLAFASTMLMLNSSDFDLLCKIVQEKSIEEDYTYRRDAKSITIATPAQGVYILLTKNELLRFNEILEEADSEVKALSLLSLFDI